MAQSISFDSSPATPSLGLETKIAAIIQNILTLTLLLLALPINTAIVFIYLVVGAIFRTQTSKTSNPKNILISGGKMTKALQLARSFHAAGHRVVLVETHKYWLTGHRFSQAVDKFYTTPAPQKDPEAYIQALEEIVKRENIDVYIPLPVQWGVITTPSPNRNYLPIAKYCILMQRSPKCWMINLQWQKKRDRLVYLYPNPLKSPLANKSLTLTFPVRLANTFSKAFPTTQ